MCVCVGCNLSFFLSPFFLFPSPLLEEEEASSSGYTPPAAVVSGSWGVCMCVCVCVFGGVVVLEWSRPHICRRSTCDGWRKISSCCCPSRGDSPSLCRQCLALEEFLSGARVTPLISHQTAGSVNLSSISNTQSSQMWRAEP